LDKENDLIRGTIVFGLRTFGADPLPVQADLEYDPEDPYAVVVAYHSGGGTVRWMFGRDLLADGLLTPSGEGDVIISPADDTSIVIFALSAPDGCAVLEASAEELAEFLDRTYDVVPAGSEQEWFDFDQEMAKLVTES